MVAEEFTVKTREEVEAALKAAGISGAVHGNARSYTVSLAGVYVDSPRWTYDGLVILSRELGTTDISFQWEKGWGGTDVTPGDPDDLLMRIGWP